MNLITAREWVAGSAWNASGDNSVFTNADYDRAILYVGNRFCRVTRYLQNRSLLSLTADSSALPAFPTGFAPERTIRAWIGTKPALKVTDYQAILDSHENSPATGHPQAMGFSGRTSGMVWPTPDANYTLNLLWWRSFNTFTVNTASPGSITFDLPDEVMCQILPTGAAAWLRFANPEAVKASAGWQEYLAIEAGYRGVGNMGARVLYREGGW
jgi:hypothetical protein